MAATSPLNVFLRLFWTFASQFTAEDMCSNSKETQKKEKKNAFITFWPPSWTKTWCCQPQLLQQCFLKCKNPSQSSYELPVHNTEVVKARQADDWISMLLYRRCCPQIAKATRHRVSSAPKESRLIGSHQQLNIPKWQHLISSFCPGASLALSLPPSPVSPSHFSEHHYLIITQHTNLQTNTQWHEWINLLKCAHLSCCGSSPDTFALPRLLAFQVTSCCLNSTTNTYPTYPSRCCWSGHSTSHPWQHLQL